MTRFFSIGRALCFLLVALAAQASYASASSWLRVASSADGLVDFYVDKSSIKGGHERTGRVLYDYKNVQQDPDTLQEHRSTVVSARADCVQPRLGVIRSANYGDAMGRGKVSDLAATATPTMRDVSSGTIDDRIRAVLCGKQPSR